MKISIIIPVYNVEKYIRACLDSVLNQTLDSIEIIVINDGSTDNSYDILKEYKDINPKIRLFNQKNQGLSQTRNKGIELANGEYIYFLDSDDYLTNNAMELCYNKIKELNTDMLTFNAKSFYDEEYLGNYPIEKFNKGEFVDDKKIYSGVQFVGKLFENRVYNVPVWLYLYKTSFLKENNIKFVKDIIYEDDIFTFKSLVSCESVCYINEFFLNRRIRNESIVTSKLKEKNILSSLEVAQRLEKMYVENISSFDHNTKVRIYEYIRGIYLKTLSVSEYIHINFLKNKIINKIQESIFCDDLYISMYKTSKYLYESKDILKLIFNVNLNKPIVFLFLTPYGGNLGDHAIAMSEVVFLKENLPEYQIIEISGCDFGASIKYIKSIIKSSDIIFIQGGGNIGDEYIQEENMRRLIINEFRENNIIIFPQTLYFKGTDQSIRELEFSRAIYNNHNKLTLVARDITSYELMNKYFNCDILLTPDIVLKKKDIWKKQNYTRRGVVLTLRNDKERFLREKDKQELLKNIYDRFDKVTHLDTNSHSNILAQNREFNIQSLLDRYSRSEFVITDRLHGMIFAYITDTPCIVFRNYNYKISDQYKWIEECNYIKFANESTCINTLIDELFNIKVKTSMDLSYKFKALEHRVREISSKHVNN